jgi:hypothetical protein
MEGYSDSTYGDAFADVYDDWYPEVTDVAATVARMAELAGHGGSVLELGVGTGRLALPRASTLRSLTVLEGSVTLAAPGDAAALRVRSGTTAALPAALGVLDCQLDGAHALLCSVLD